MELWLGGDSKAVNVAKVFFLLGSFSVCILTTRLVKVKPYTGLWVRGPRDLTLGLGLEEKNGVITLYILGDDTKAP